MPFTISHFDRLPPRTVLGVLLLLLAGCGPAMTPKQTQPFLEARAEFKTKLVKKGPSPGLWNPADAPPPGARKVVYQSGDYALGAWFAMPPKAKEPVPAVVYLHGGFSFGKEDFDAARPFLEAGNALMTPMLRGENGNPGDFELWYGELEDAAAAIRWLARQPGIDPKRIHAFGHSVGGGVAALLSLADPELPLAGTGSSGGLYGYEVFQDWHKEIPFNPRDRRERQLRILLGNTWWMKRPHHAYLGMDDPLHRIIPLAENEVRASKAPLTVQAVPGDHATSLSSAVHRYLSEIEKRR